MSSHSFESYGYRSVAGGTIGTAITGDVIGLPAEVLTAARDVPAPPGLTNLPPYPLCLGRDDVLTQLRASLTETNGTAITQASTVHGLGGIGKSTLALAYAHRHRSDYSLVWWVNADSPTRIEQALAGLARRLLPAWAGATSQDQQAEWAMAWLQWHSGWLLVFDNAEKPADLDYYLGALNKGHHLISSRRATGWPHTIRTIALGTLHSEDAAQLICMYAFPDSTPTARELQEARELAVELGYLPLALEQAGAYLRQNPTITIDSYRRRLLNNLDKAADSIDAERTIARIWNQTVRDLAARNPRAVNILRTLAWLAPDGVPISLLETSAADDHEFHEALGLLNCYSMVNITERTVSIHRLIQTVLRSTAPDGPDGSPAGRRAAENALLKVLNQCGSPQGIISAEWDALMPQLIALAITRPEETTDNHTENLYTTAAEYLHQQGHITRAIPFYEAIVAQRRRALGDTSPDTITSCNNLAAAYQSAGDLARAIPLFETTLVQYTRVLGNAHPDTLVCCNNLAAAYGSVGDFKRAIQLHEATLAHRERFLGNTHPSTLASRANLASTYLSAGDLARAIQLHEATLAHRERFLGDSHPDTAMSRNNLAGAYQSAGYFTRATSLYETSLNQFERVLGETHPTTLVARTNLAHAYRLADDLARAIPLYESTLAQLEQILGETHPNTLLNRSNLACAYQSAGQTERSIQLHEVTLAMRERILGTTHPDTITSRNNLAGSLYETGDLTRALPLLETALAQSQQVLGETHLSTLSSLSNLACTYQSVGEFERAISLGEMALNLRERSLGESHPDTINSRINLANFYYEIGNFEHAIPLFEATLADREKLLGDSHPSTVKTRKALAESIRQRDKRANPPT
ncbi:tetratricopeptide repeat protein [Kitasatospora sp. NPDC059577]|uniref:tetratricopeptide repeat protein n=1 Tax=Kitasatospora sp. NPDC059577 TaxID=3346873 RepID=UPI0036AF65A9